MLSWSSVTLSSSLAYLGSRLLFNFLLLAVLYLPASSLSNMAFFNVFYAVYQILFLQGVSKVYMRPRCGENYPEVGLAWKLICISGPINILLLKFIYSIIQCIINKKCSYRIIRRLNNGANMMKTRAAEKAHQQWLEGDGKYQIEDNNVVPIYLKIINKGRKKMQQGWQLLTASKTITIHTSELQSGAPATQYNPHRGIVNCAVYNHTGKVIASCGQDGKIALHSAQRCQDRLLQLTYHSAQEEPSSINCCLFSPKSKFIAAGSVNSTVKVWDMKCNKQKQQALHKLKGHAGAVTSIAWLNGEELIASSSTSGDILMHDVSTGAIRDSLTSRLQEGISNIKVSEGQGYRRLGACTTSGSLMVWDVNVSTKKPIYTYEDPKKASFTCLSISQFSPVLMVCSSSDSSFVFMDINQRKVIKTICTQEQLTSIAFNDDGQMLAAGGMSGGISIYDLRKIQAPLFKLQGHDTPIKSVCFGEKQKDKDKQRLKTKDRDYGTSSNFSRTTSNLPQNLVENKDKLKVLTPVISSNKQTPEEQKGGSRVVRNLVKKQQNSTKVQTQAPQQVVRTVQPVVPPTTTIIPTTTVTQNNYARSSSTIPYSNLNGVGSQQTTPQLKTLEQKMMGEMRNMQMRLNQKFEMLHLEVIRQMQLSVEKISSNFEKKYSTQRQLQNKIKQLQQQNENLKKRTY